METNVSAVELFPIDDKTTLSEEASQAPNKYKYDEFAGFEGERRLKDIMRKILSLALYRTWEILVARQAPGNDCYLGIRKLAEIAMRTDRKLRMDINELIGRQLLKMYSALKPFVQPDGSIHLRPVQIKDFTGLYDLAHEYYMWMQSPNYIEPEREYMDLVKADEKLYKKLRRFECYKRLLCNQVPGPKPQPNPIHAWYEDYETDVDKVEIVQEQIKEAKEQIKETDGKPYLSKKLSKQLKKDSTERKESNEKENNLNRDSFDSDLTRRKGDPLAPSVSIAQVYTKNEPTLAPPLSPSSSISPANATNPPETIQELGGAKQTSKQGKQAGKQGKHTNEQVDKQAVSWKQTQQGRRKYQGDGKGQPAPNALVSSFVWEVSMLFHDQNVKASVTRLLRLFEGQGLTQEQIVICLVRAYWVTQETKKVLPQYQRPEGPIKMPLFCSMVGRFIIPARKTPALSGMGIEGRSLWWRDGWYCYTIEYPCTI